MEPSSSHSPSSSKTSTTQVVVSYPCSGERARVVGIGKRPLNYTGGDGWASRIGYTTLYGGALGTGMGVLLARSKCFSVLKWAGSMGTNSALVTLCFCGSQELVREVRASDPEDLVNCVLGGLASGGLLGRITGGSSRALPYALLFSVVGTGLQFGANQFRQYRLRRFLERRNPEVVLESDVKSRAQLERGNWKLPEWFPVQVLGHEAATKRKSEKEKEFRDRVERLHRGEK